MLQAISVSKGVITLVDEKGVCCQYLQRGITKMSMMKRAELGKQGLLDSHTSFQCKELPHNISLYMYDEDGNEIRPCLTYNEEKEKELLASC